MLPENMEQMETDLPPKRRLGEQSVRILGVSKRSLAKTSERKKSMSDCRCEPSENASVSEEAPKVGRGS
jgi:hypothetical protein